MDKKKLPLEQLKVKSFITVMDSGNQKTAKGGFINRSFKASWTTIKTQLAADRPEGGIEL